MLNISKLLAGIGIRACQTSLLSRTDRKIYMSSLSRANHELNDDLNNALEEIMETVPPDSGALSPGDTLNIFRMMNKTTVKFSDITYKLNEHQKFPVLRQAAQASIPYYKTGELIDMLKTIQVLNVSLDDSLSNLMISTLRTKTYDMSLNEIMLLDSFLRFNGKKKTNLAEALQRDLIQRFNLLTIRTRVNFTYFEYMRRMLRFVHLNWHHIDKHVLENMSRNATEQNVSINTAEEAMKIIMELSRSPDGCKHFGAVLEKAFDVWSTGDVTIEMIQKILPILIQWKSRIDSDIFNDKRFVGTCAQKVMNTCDFDLCLSIQVQFNQLKFTSYPLIDFLSDHIADIDLDAPDTFSKIVTYCKACNVAAYVPLMNVNERIQQFPFEKYFDPSMNWPMFACQLHSMGIHRPQMIEKILENEKSRRKYKVYFDLLKDIQTISNENLTYNDSNKKLTDDLLDIIGSNKLLESVRIGTNLMIPFLIKVDKATRNLTPFDKQTDHPLKRARGQELIAILSEPETSEVPAFDLLCTNLSEKKIALIVLDGVWNILPLSKQVDHIYTSIATILRDRKKIVRTSSYAETK